MDRSNSESPKPPRRSAAVVPPFIPRRAPTPLSTPAVPATRGAARPFAGTPAPKDAMPAVPSVAEPAQELTQSVADSELTSRLADGVENTLGIESNESLAHGGNAEGRDGADADGAESFHAHQAVSDDSAESAFEAPSISTGAIADENPNEHAHEQHDEAAVAPPVEPAHADETVELSWDTSEHAAPASFEFDSYTAFADIEAVEIDAPDIGEPAAHDASDTVAAVDEGSAAVASPTGDVADDAERASVSLHRSDEVADQMESPAHEASIEMAPLMVAVESHVFAEPDGDEANDAAIAQGNESPEAVELDTLKEIEPWAMATPAAAAPTTESRLADALEGIAARIRSGELAVPGGMHQDTDQSALTVALLAIQLSSGR